MADEAEGDLSKSDKNTSLISNIQNSTTEERIVKDEDLNKILAKDRSKIDKQMLTGNDEVNCEAVTQQLTKELENHDDGDAEDNDEDDSPADYEYSLRVENIRLKSRLEQAKERFVVVEQEKKRYQEDYEKEKKFADKANASIYKLMKEKQSLQEELKRPHNNLHHEDIQEVVAKLEHEIYVLEDRLDRQRKRYQQEHMMLYEDLKEERREQQNWKHTYMKSQVAVMAFRRRLLSMKDKIPSHVMTELSRCLVIPDDQEDRVKFDLTSKQSDISPVSYHAVTKQHKDDISAHSKSSDINHDRRDEHRPNSPYVMLSNHKEFTKIEPSKYSNRYDQIGDYHTNNGDSVPNHEQIRSPSEDSAPKVFVMEDESELVDLNSKSNHYSPHSRPHISSPKHQTLRQSPYEHQRLHSPKPADTSCSQQRNGNFHRYELDGTKHHHQSYSNGSYDYKHRDHSPQYKHWHHYSVENPGHGLRTQENHKYREKSHHGNIEPVMSSYEQTSSPIMSNHRPGSSHSSREGEKYRGYSSKDVDHSDRLELDANDTKFLELKFDNAFLKQEYKPTSVSTKLYQSNTSALNRSFEEKSIPQGTPLESKKIWCLTCDGEVTKKPCGHTNLVIQEREKEFPCPTCGRLFNNRSHLKRHNMIHSGEKPWACSYCDKRFNRKSHLNRHLLTHTGEKPFKCPYCGKGFADNSDLKRHKQVHESTPGFVPILPKEPAPSFSNHAPSSVAITIPTVPTIMSIPPKKKVEERRFPCVKCGKIFTRKSHLTRHKLTHDQQKIYCDCGRMFRQNSHLQAHLPACKRKRDALEAKYIAQHTVASDSSDILVSSSPTMNGIHSSTGTESYSMHTYLSPPKKENPSLSMDEDSVQSKYSDEQTRPNFNTVGEMNPLDSNFNTIEAIDSMETQDDTLLIGIDAIHPRIPPLIRDPA